MSNEPIPETIWHYTSLQAAIKILRHRCFRLFDARRGNDFEEGQQFERALIAKTGFKGGYLKSVWPFVCCFSGEEDSAHQFISYAQRGSGVAIGIQGRRLIKLWERKRDEWDSNGITHRGMSNVSGVVCQVDYRKQEEMAEIVERWLDGKYADVIDGGPLAYSEFIFAFKNWGFRAENEYRLIISIDREVLPAFAESCMDSLKPYLELSFNPELVTNIVLGPNCPATVEEMQFFVEKREANHHWSVSQSRCSLR